MNGLFDDDHHESTIWEAWTPAKINLFLEVLRRREDGYHDLETVMAAVAVYDTLLFQSDPSPRIDVRTIWTSGIRGTYESLSAAVGDVPNGTTNIVARALTLLRERAEVGYGATVRVRKRIPSAAGLGGASSDAAAALAMANRAWGLDWSRAQLQAVAGEIGSDVPFFLSETTAALCHGRGERIEPLRWRWRPALVLVRPPEGLSTPNVFRHVSIPATPRSAVDLIGAAQRGDYQQIRTGVHNRLQQPASHLSSWIGRLTQAFNRLPVMAHQMSGSGSTYFGVCRNLQQANHVANRLRAAHWGHVMQTTTTQAYPVIRRRANELRSRSRGNH